MNAIALFGMPLMAALLIGSAAYFLMGKFQRIASLKNTRILLAFLFGFGCGAYVLLASIAVNNQAKIAQTILFTDDASTIPGYMAHPAPALEGAMNGKFPAGTKVENLKNFVAMLEGHCYQDQIGHPLHCTIIEFGTICIQRSLLISAETNSQNQITRIEAARRFDGC